MHCAFKERGSIPEIAKCLLSHKKQLAVRQCPLELAKSEVANSHIWFKTRLLPTNANLGRIMRIMETNISLLELLFVLNNQIIDINIRLLAMLKSLFGVTKMIFKRRNHLSTTSRNLLYFTL